MVQEPDSLPAAPSSPDRHPAADVDRFSRLRAPKPVAPTPPPSARWLAFALTLLAGLFGGLIGYGVGDLLSDSTVWPAIGALVGALISAVGVGVVANLTLQAMAEWRQVRHPEADEGDTDQ